MEEVVSSTVQEHLDSEDWDALYPRLFSYARRKANGLSFLKERSELPLGRTYKDLVQDAIAKVFRGERNWNPDKNPDLYVYLTSVIDSLFSGLLNRSGHRNRDPLDPSEMEGSQKSDYNDCLKALETLVRDTSSDDENLDDVRQGIEDGMSPGEIADFFGIDVKEVYNLKRKLRRRIDRKMKTHPCNDQWRSSLANP